MEKESKKEEACVFDTSALITLGIAGLIREVLDEINIFVTRGVVDELKAFAKFNDKYGKASREVLLYENNFVILECEIKEVIVSIQEIDNGLYNLAKEKNLALITDDIKLYRKVCEKIKVDFSTSILVALIIAGKLDKERALGLLEELRELRNWRNNIIYLTARNEIENLEN